MEDINNIKGKDGMMDAAVKDGMADGTGKGRVPGTACPEPEDEFGGNDLYVKFREPYVFEEDTYKGIDLSCIEHLSANDIIDIEKRFYKLGITCLNPENTVAYARIVAQKASGLPIEFFEDLPARDILKVKGKIVNFFFG